jgi:hypothetical protein
MFALGDLVLGERSSWQLQAVIHQRIYLNYGRTSFWLRIPGQGGHDSGINPVSIPK